MQHPSPATLLVTGGCGFIGSAVVRRLIATGAERVVNVDKLTYAGHESTVREAAASSRYRFVHCDIADAAAIREAFNHYRPGAVMHLAAESHVDRSIDGPGDFVHTNVVGSYVMLQEALHYWQGLDATGRDAFRYLHVSTDEVFGSLGPSGRFTEKTAYDPRSPYAASKAASDHFVRAWQHTYGLPTLITNCSNNYGPFQFPEKLIPLTILNALEHKPLPVYGDGSNIRDWLHVADHADALLHVLRYGVPGNTYNVGSDNERTNLEIVNTICDIVDECRPDDAGSDSAGSRRDLITFVTDRPGHDFRYSIDATKLKNDLGWQPSTDFASGLRSTVEWYLNNLDWCHEVQQDNYSRERLGLKTES